MVLWRIRLSAGRHCYTASLPFAPSAQADSPDSHSPLFGSPTNPHAVDTHDAETGLAPVNLLMSASRQHELKAASNLALFEPIFFAAGRLFFLPAEL